MFHLDESQQPVIVVAFDGALSDAEVEELLARFEAIADRGERIVYVIDAARADWLTATQRQRVIEVMKRRKSRTKSYCAGMALVMSRSVPRVMLKALLAVVPLSIPYAVFARFDEAATWASDRLRAEGQTPPASPIVQRRASRPAPFASAR